MDEGASRAREHIRGRGGSAEASLFFCFRGIGTGGSGSTYFQQFMLLHPYSHQTLVNSLLLFYFFRHNFSNCLSQNLI